MVKNPHKKISISKLFHQILKESPPMFKTTQASLAPSKSPLPIKATLQEGQAKKPSDIKKDKINTQAISINPSKIIKEMI